MKKDSHPGTRRRSGIPATTFNTRQYMETPDYELFYYHDPKPVPIVFHRHGYYEFYFFLEGAVDYQIGGTACPLSFGDCLLIPPGVDHRPLFRDRNVPYRRFVLWLSRAFCEQMRETSPDLIYAFAAAEKTGEYLLRGDPLHAREIHGRLVEMVEEDRGRQPFRETGIRLMIASFLLYISRLAYQQRHPFEDRHEKALYLDICGHIDRHLEEELSLDALAAVFFVSKYHIAHLFKDNMGISPHQYLLKKRLQASRGDILSGTPFKQVSVRYGFKDYTSFYRAFKKEFGLSPTEFRRQEHMPGPSRTGVE